MIQHEISGSRAKTMITRSALIGLLAAGCGSDVDPQPIDPNSQWVVSVISGTVRAQRWNANAPWDEDGPPDPRVCLTAAGIRECTEIAMDNYSPLWNRDLLVVRASVLINNQLNIDYFDADGDGRSGNEICNGESMPFTEQQLAAGNPVTFYCVGGNIVFGVRPVGQ